MLLVLLGAFVAWRGAQRDDVVGPADGTAKTGPRATDDRKQDAPTLVAAAARATAADVPVGASAPRERASFRVRVTLLGSSASAEIAVVLREGDGRRTLARGRAEPGVAVELPVETDAPLPWNLELRALVPGVARIDRAFTATPGEVVDVELRVPTGHRLTGTVIDREDRPVADVGLRMTQMPGEAIRELWDQADDGGLLALGTTDRAGRFDVVGLAAGGYVLEASDPGLWLERAGGGPAWLQVPGEAVALRVLPAFRIAVTLQSAAVDDDPAAWGALRWTLAHGSTGMDVNGPGTQRTFRGPMRGAPDEPVAFLVRVRSPLHAPEERRFTLTPSRREHELTVQLRRVPEGARGTVGIEPLPAKAGGERVGLHATFMASETGTPWASSEERVPTTTERDGTLVLSLPVGEQTLRLEPRLPFRWLLAWEVRVRVYGGVETTPDLHAPAWAPVRIAWKDAAPAGEVELDVRNMSVPGDMHATESVSVEEGAVRIPALPAGTWLCTAKDTSGTTWTARFAVEGEQPVDVLWTAAR